MNVGRRHNTEWHTVSSGISAAAPRIMPDASRNRCLYYGRAARSAQRRIQERAAPDVLIFVAVVHDVKFRPAGCGISLQVADEQVGDALAVMLGLPCRVRGDDDVVERP